MATFQIDTTALRGVNLDPRSRREQQIAANKARADEIRAREVTYQQEARTSLPFSDQTNRNIMTNWKRFESFLALREPNLRGPILYRHLETYLPQFLTHVVEHSRKEVDGKVQYMKLSTLVAIRMCIHSYLRIVGKMVSKDVDLLANYDRRLIFFFFFFFGRAIQPSITTSACSRFRCRMTSSRNTG